MPDITPDFFRTRLSGAEETFQEELMKNRVALLGIVVEDLSSTARMNEILSDYGNYVIGRMGIPYRERGVSIISIVLDAPDNVISSLSGKIGMLPGVSAKTVYSKVFTTDQTDQEVL